MNKNNTLKIRLEPWWITGITDSEGSFTCYIKNNDKTLTNYSVTLEYKVTQKEHSESILYDLKSFFDTGSVVIDNRKSETKKYHVTSIKSIVEKVIPHFNSYNCLTSKYLNFKD